MLSYRSYYHSQCAAPNHTNIAPLQRIIFNLDSVSTTVRRFAQENNCNVHYNGDFRREHLEQPCKFTALFISEDFPHCRGTNLSIPLDSRDGPRIQQSIGFPFAGLYSYVTPSGRLARINRLNPFCENIDLRTIKTAVDWGNVLVMYELANFFDKFFCQERDPTGERKKVTFSYPIAYKCSHGGYLFGSYVLLNKVMEELSHCLNPRIYLMDKVHANGHTYANICFDVYDAQETYCSLRFYNDNDEHEERSLFELLVIFNNLMNHFESDRVYPDWQVLHARNTSKHPDIVQSFDKHMFQQAVIPYSTEEFVEDMRVGNRGAPDNHELILTNKSMDYCTTATFLGFLTEFCNRGCFFDSFSNKYIISDVMPHSLLMYCKDTWDLQMATVLHYFMKIVQRERFNLVNGSSTYHFEDAFLVMTPEEFTHTEELFAFYGIENMFPVTVNGTPTGEFAPTVQVFLPDYVYECLTCIFPCLDDSTTPLLFMHFVNAFKVLVRHQ